MSLRALFLREYATLVWERGRAMLNLEEMKKNLMNWMPRVLFFVIILYAGFFLIRRLIAFLERRFELKKIDPTALGFFMSILHFFLRALVVVLGLGVLNVPMASISAVVGAATLSIGLGLQGSLSNLAGGLVLVTTEPFKVGDFIVSDGFEGTVEEISILSTRLRSVDGKKIVIPNAIVSSKALVNFSSSALRRIDIPVPVSYEASIDRVKSTLKRLAQEVQDAQNIEVLLSQYTDRGYQFILRLWLPKEIYFEQFFLLQEKIKPAFDEEGIALAYPLMHVIHSGGCDEKIF